LIGDVCLGTQGYIRDRLTDLFLVYAVALILLTKLRHHLDTWSKRCGVAGKDTTALHETGDGGFIFADVSDALGGCLRNVFYDIVL